MTHTKPHPLIVLPPGTITDVEPFIAAAAQIDASENGTEAYHVVIRNGIEDEYVLGHRAVICGNSCDWHNDDHMSNCFGSSALLVIRNDANSWVETRERRKHREQPIGTLVLLDILRTHRLACGKKPGDWDLWMALVIDYPGMVTVEQAVKDMQNLIRYEWRAKTDG